MTPSQAAHPLLLPTSPCCLRRHSRRSPLSPPPLVTSVAPHPVAPPPVALVPCPPPLPPSSILPSPLSPPPPVASAMPSPIAPLPTSPYHLHRPSPRHPSPLSSHRRVCHPTRRRPSLHAQIDACPPILPLPSSLGWHRPPSPSLGKLRHLSSRAAASAPVPTYAQMRLPSHAAARLARSDRPPSPSLSQLCCLFFPVVAASLPTNTPPICSPVTTLPLASRKLRLMRLPGTRAIRHSSCRLLRRCPQLLPRLRCCPLRLLPSPPSSLSVSPALTLPPLSLPWSSAHPQPKVRSMHLRGDWPNGS